MIKGKQISTNKNLPSQHESLQGSGLEQSWMGWAEAFVRNVCPGGV